VSTHSPTDARPAAAADAARFAIWARAFAIGSLVHLMLPDFEQDGWWLPGLVEGIGALWLLWRPAAPAFAICLIGTLWPLLFLRDVLTQSALLSLWALVGLVGAVRPRLRSAALDAVLWVTAGTYLLAALHKLNSAFFTPELGCAEHAWAQVAARYGLPDALPGAPFVAVGMEVALGVLLLRRSLWAWPLGLAFHLPLTVTLAPAFGAVTLSGYVAGLDARTLVRWRRLLRRWPLWVVGAGVAGLEYAWAGQGELAPALKTGVAAVLLFVSVIAGLRWRPAAAATALAARGRPHPLGGQRPHALLRRAVPARRRHAEWPAHRRRLPQQPGHAGLAGGGGSLCAHRHRLASRPARARAHLAGITVESAGAAHHAPKLVHSREPPHHPHGHLAGRGVSHRGSVCRGLAPRAAGG
jgi:hypothetical protein